jgi:hypothetical protein
MDPYFREMYEQVRAAALHMMAASKETVAAHELLIVAHDHLVKANDELATGGQALTRSIDAALHAQEEHEDLRESVRRLEALVEELLRRQNGQTGR